MKRLLRVWLFASVALFVVLAIGLALQDARAQTVGSPGGTMLVSPVRPQTYSASFTAITPAASATDFLVITGSATRTVYLRSLECSGVSTAAAVSTVALVKRSTADTGGTALTPSATVGGQLVPLDASDAAATATVTAYSANPTTGTLVGLVRSQKISTQVPTGATPSSILLWTFANEYTQSVVLRGTAQVLGLSGLGSSLAAGTVLTCDLTWIEQ